MFSWISLHHWCSLRFVARSCKRGVDLSLMLKILVAHRCDVPSGLNEIMYDCIALMTYTSSGGWKLPIAPAPMLLNVWSKYRCRWLMIMTEVTKDTSIISTTNNAATSLLEQRRLKSIRSPPHQCLSLFMFLVCFSCIYVPKISITRKQLNPRNIHLCVGRCFHGIGPILWLKSRTGVGLRSNLQSCKRNVWLHLTLWEVPWLVFCYQYFPMAARCMRLVSPHSFVFASLCMNFGLPSSEVDFSGMLQ